MKAIKIIMIFGVLTISIVGLWDGSAVGGLPDSGTCTDKVERVYSPEQALAPLRMAQSSSLRCYHTFTTCRARCGRQHKNDPIPFARCQKGCADAYNACK